MWHPACKKSFQNHEEKKLTALFDANSSWSQSSAVHCHKHSVDLHRRAFLTALSRPPLSTQLKHKFMTLLPWPPSLLLLFLLPHHCLSAVDIVRRRLHDPCGNMKTWCTHCYVWNQYRNDSVCRSELRFSDVSHLFLGTVSACWPWSWFCFLCPLPSWTDACSARSQQDATDTTHVQLVVSSWNHFSEASLIFTDSNIFHCIEYNLHRI